MDIYLSFIRKTDKPETFGYIPLTQKKKNIYFFFTDINSTSKMRVAFAGITGGYPLSP